MERVTWARLAELAGDGMSAAGMREVARRHELDLPHVPTISHDGGHRWTVSCLGCRLDTGWTGPSCQQGRWAAPPLLLDAAGIDGALQAVAIVLAESTELDL